jgi:DNA primase
MISRLTIDKVMDTARIEEVVGDFVSLKRRGSSMLGLCPFHNEKSPSFNVSPARGIYKCFGCGQAGNSVRFIMELEKMSYPEAIRYLAKKYHIDVDEEDQTDEVKQEIQERESLFLVNQWATQFYKDQLWETETGKAIGLSYFRERGFSDETIRKFELGFHPDGWSTLSDAARNAGYNMDYMVRVGLTIDKEGKQFDRFKNRVMFPIHNLSGKVIGFGGRILITDKKQAKYLNSPESDVYHKSAVLYGIHLARKAIMTQDVALLVEGYTDVISMHQAGIENVVSSSGTSLTADQVKIILRYTKNVTILYDGDPAGIKASFRGLDMILEQGMNVKVVLFPDGEDPDSFARNNSPVFVKEYIQKEAKDFIEFKTSVLQAETKGDPIKTAEMIREIIHSLSLIPDPILRSLYIRKCASSLDMSEQTLLLELNNQVRNSRKKQERESSNNASSQASSPAPPDDFWAEMDEGGSETKKSADNSPSLNDKGAISQEADIIRILIRFANATIVFHSHDDRGKEQDIQLRVGDFILQELINDELYPINSSHHRIFMMFTDVGENDYPTENYFLHNEDHDIASIAIDLTSNPHTLSEHWKEKHQIYITDEEMLMRKMVLSSVYSYKLRRVQLMLLDIDNQLKKSMDEELQIELLQQHMSLQKAKLALASQLSYVIL